MDVIIIPACRHVAPASLLPPSKKAGTTGTQPDYPINLLWERGRAAGGEVEGGKRREGEDKKENVEQRGKERKSDEGVEDGEGGVLQGKRPKRNWSRKNGAGWVNSVFQKKDRDKDSYEREVRASADMWRQN